MKTRKQQLHSFPYKVQFSSQVCLYDPISICMLMEKLNDQLMDYQQLYCSVTISISWKNLSTSVQIMSIHTLVLLGKRLYYQQLCICKLTIINKSQCTPYCVA